MNNIDKIYELRNNFLILGLTGRTGSGCSTVAKLLSNVKFEDCDFPKPLSGSFPHNEDRKYSIVYNYLEKNWSSFTIIRASDVITSILLENDFESVKEFLSKKYNNREVLTEIFNAVEKDYQLLHEQRLKVKALPDSEYGEQVIKKKASYDFHFKDQVLSKFTSKLKNEFNKIGFTGLPTPFQFFGNNIRSSGKALDDSFNPENCYKIPSIINKLTKAIKQELNQGYIIIDSLRNPLEALYFKERYSAFYLLAVNTENDFRLKRLSFELSLEKIKDIDNSEYTDKKGVKRFVEQDIKGCIQIADIYLYNPNDHPGDKFETLKKQIVKYLSLVKQPAIVTPSPEERCMQFAYTAKYNSGCISRQVGAVVTDGFYSIKSVGWNNTAEGQTPCSLRNVEDLLSNSDKDSFSKYEKSEDFKNFIKPIFKNKLKSANLLGKNVSFCFKDVHNCKEGDKNQVHTRSLHAEENAFLQITKYGGQSIHRGYLFTTASPCELCSKKAFQLGIKKVFYIDPYPGIAMDHILSSGIEKNNPEMVLFNGAIGRAYHQVYQPFLPYKDELKLILDLKFPDNTELQKIKLENESLKNKIKELEKKKA